LTLLYLRSALAQAGAQFLRLWRISVKILSKPWRVAFVQQVAQVIVNMWLELLICGAASVAVLILIVDRS